MKLNFPGRLHLNEIIGRLLGPDTTDRAYSVATDAVYDEENDCTRVTVRPVGPAELKSPNIVIDRWGQPWVAKVMTQETSQ